MPRKPTKGYFVRGQFVAAGSALDEQFQAERRGGVDVSKTQRKRDSADLQRLGEALAELPLAKLEPLDLDASLVEAIAQARKITDFEGLRRQRQLIGKRMRALSPEQQQAVRSALAELHSGSAEATAALHRAERWREALLAKDEALSDWAQQHPASDLQALRALVRQARKDALSTLAPHTPGAAPRQRRAYRELFQWIQGELSHAR